MADVFVSYAREDVDVARALAELLEERGWSVWWDRELVPGNTFDEVIEREITAASAVVVLWSKVSVTSQWVRSEGNAAVERNVLVPVVIETTTVPLRFRMVQSVDLTGWTGSRDDPRVEELVAGIEALAGPPRPPSHDWQPPSQVVEAPPPPAAARRRRALVVGLAAIGAVVAAVVAAVLLAGGDGDGDGETARTTIADTTIIDTTDVDVTTDSTGNTTEPGDEGVLAYGDRGDDVRDLQRMLRDSGIAPELEADGIFGPLTQQALLTFQQDYGLPETGEILVGGEEWDLLLAAAEIATPSAELVPVPDVYALPVDEAVALLEESGFAVDTDQGCSDSVDAGLVRQVTYSADDSDDQVVVVGKVAEVEATEAPGDALLRVLVANGPCS